MAGVQMGRADPKPVAVGWGRSRRRCVCPRRYGQTHRGHGRKDEDARERGRAFHEWHSLTSYSAIQGKPLLLGCPGPGLILATGTGEPSPRVFVFTCNSSFLRKIL